MVDGVESLLPRAMVIVTSYEFLGKELCTYHTTKLNVRLLCNTRY